MYFISFFSQCFKLKMFMYSSIKLKMFIYSSRAFSVTACLLQIIMNGSENRSSIKFTKQTSEFFCWLWVVCLFVCFWKKYGLLLFVISFCSGKKKCSRKNVYWINMYVLMIHLACEAKAYSYSCLLHCTVHIIQDYLQHEKKLFLFQSCL